MRFVINIVVTVTLFNIFVDGRVDDNFTKRKRQSWRCGSTYVYLSSREPECGLPTLDYGIPSFTVDLFEKLCSSETCINVVKTLLRVCESDITESQLPAEYQDIDPESFFDLFCTKVSNGTYCYSKLPLFNDSNTDPVASCQSLLNGGTCRSSCRQDLLHYTSTCCFATYLELLPDHQYNIQPTSLWGRCNIVSPQTCNISINGTAGTNTPVGTDSSGTPANTGSPGNNDGTSNTATSHPGTSDGNDNGNDVSSSTSHSDDKGSKIISISVSVGMVIMILVVAVPATLVILLLYYKRKRRSQLTTTGSEDVMRMSLANNEDPDD